MDNVPEGLKLVAYGGKYNEIKRKQHKMKKNGSNEKSIITFAANSLQKPPSLS